MRKFPIAILGIVALLMTLKVHGQAQSVMPGGEDLAITILVVAPEGANSVLIDCNKELDDGWIEKNLASPIGAGTYRFDHTVKAASGRPFVFNASYMKGGRRTWILDPSRVTVNGTVLNRSFLRKAGEANWWVKFE